MNFHLFDQLPPIQSRLPINTQPPESEVKETQPCEANLFNNSSEFGKFGKCVKNCEFSGIFRSLCWLSRALGFFIWQHNFHKKENFQYCHFQMKVFWEWKLDIHWSQIKRDKNFNLKIFSPCDLCDCQHYYHCDIIVVKRHYHDRDYQWW